MDLDVITFGSLPRETYRLAAAAEQAGFSGFWITEGGHPAFNAATAAALATSDTTVGTAIAVAFARSPMVTAQAAWELAETTNGQFILGLGTQVRAHIERRYSAAFDAPGPRMCEYVAAVRAIFAAFRGAAKLDFSGDFYSFSLLPPDWSPGPISVADPKVYVAGVSPWMLRMIGGHADGLHVHPLHSVRYLDDTVLPALAEVPRALGAIPTTLPWCAP